MRCRIAGQATPWGEHRLGHVGDSGLITHWTSDMCVESVRHSQSLSHENDDSKTEILVTAARPAIWVIGGSFWPENLGKSTFSWPPWIDITFYTDSESEKIFFLNWSKFDHLVKHYKICLDNSILMSSFICNKSQCLNLNIFQDTASRVT